MYETKKERRQQVNPKRNEEQKQKNKRVKQKTGQENKNVRRVITNERSTRRKQNAEREKKEKGGLVSRVNWRVVVHPLYFLWEEQRN